MSVRGSRRGAGRSLLHAPVPLALGFRYGALGRKLPLEERDSRQKECRRDQDRDKGLLSHVKLPLSDYTRSPEGFDGAAFGSTAHVSRSAAIGFVRAAVHAGPTLA